MSSLRKLTPLFRLIFASLIVAVALLLLFKGASDPIRAQQQERQFEKHIAKHVPLDVKISKEKEKNWKDLKNENWAKDFELEVSNTGDKPIYFFYLLTFFDVPTDSGSELIAPIHYGRPEIGNVGVKATAEDVPIKPGESKLLKINPNILLSWEKGRREKGWRLPTKVRIKLEGLSFGDGTGLMLDEGVPYRSASPQTSRRNVSATPSRGKPDAVNWRLENLRSIGTQKSISSLPAAFLPVNYVRATSNSSRADSEVLMDACEPGCSPRFNFFWVRCYGCDPQNDPYYDPSAPCTSVDEGSIDCTIPETGVTYPCTTRSLRVCISEPPPPPPWPTPTPTPTPECASCSSDAPCNYCYLPSHCNRNIGFCWVNYFYGCDEHFVDDCLWSIGYIPVGTCQCSHDYGYGGGGGGGGGGGEGWCYWSDCSCASDWECDSFCDWDGYCAWGLIDPILIDVNGHGFSMTDAGNGVMFDFFSNGQSRRISWTQSQSDDAWLVLDWNKNGTIDNGKEVFSNVTPERDPTESPIGFKALAMFDTRPFGGNGDASIDQRDPIFRLLRLWQDMNHNGISEPSELHSLPELGVESISLDYKESRRRDRWGNVFRYRAKVFGTNHSDLGRWAYDVVLLSARDSIGQVANLRSSEIDRRVAEMKMFRIFDGRRWNENQ